MKNIDGPHRFVKLLVIDDDEVDKIQLKRALKASGFQHELTEYADTQSITNISLLSSFDCIFLDYLLPGDNGLAFLKKIRDTGIKTPIVIITSQGNESIAVELMKAGASDYVIKNDINGQSLAQVIRNMLRLNEMMIEREEAYKALRISESSLAEALQIAKMGNWEFHTASNSFYVSREIYYILELNPQEPMTIVTFLALVHLEETEAVNHVWNEALQGKSYDMDIRFNTPSGTTRFAHFQGRCMLDSLGKLEKIVGIFQDITDRKLAEQEITRARELAENSMKVKEIFLANMSHEIRTPMNAILGFTRLLYETTPTAEQKGYIDAIHFSGENLLVIINDILDLSKIQSGKMNLEKCEFNIRELVNGIVGVLRPKAQERGVNLTCSIQSHVSAVIKGDPVRLNQILTNLISNGIKFTEKGSVSLEINAVAAKNQDTIIEFKVRDTGIGIQADKQSVIFENFVQASSDTTKKYGGTGLGLAIVKNLVELQDGKISVNSVYGYGSTFTVHLPFEEIRHQEKLEPFLPRKSSVGESLDQLIGAAILAVEDNPVNQMLVRKVLEKVGCKVDIASNGLKALESVRTKKYEVILMDIQMPEMDGFETTLHIRNQLAPPVSQVPIIAMTAHAFGSDVAKCMAAGMNDYISKPFKAEDLYLKLLKFVQPSSFPKVIRLKQPEAVLDHKIDLRPLYELSDGNSVFINELILEYDRQTPAFVEKLKGYIKSQNFDAIRFICHQIKYSYGILKMSALDKALTEISALIKGPSPILEMAKITALVNTIISLISAINEEVKRSLRRTG